MAVVLLGLAPVLEPLPASEEVRWGRALVMEAHGWSPHHGVMYIPALEFPDLEGLRTPGVPSIRVTLIDRSMERRELDLGGCDACPASESQGRIPLNRNTSAVPKLDGAQKGRFPQGEAL